MAEAEQQAAGGSGGGGTTSAPLLLPPLTALRAAAERVMARAVRRVMRQKVSSKETQGEDEEEVKLTLLLTWPRPPSSPSSSSSSCRLACHAQALPRPPRPPVVRAVACGQPRSNTRAKDSAWVRERRAAVELAKRAAAAFDAAAASAAAAAEAGAPPPSSSSSSVVVEETLLVGPQGALEEGASSNFFALTREGALQTAGEDVVLPGTVRAVVLAVARQGVERQVEGWPVSRVEEGRAPRLAEAGEWRACFVSSTSRQLLPVEEVLDATEAMAPAGGEAAAGGAVPVPRVAFRAGGGGGREKEEADAGVAALVAAVREAILADSEALPSL